MPRSASSPVTLDLFDPVPSAPAEDVRPTPTTPKVPLPELSNWSDSGLVQLLLDLTAELQRRRSGKTRQTDQPEFDRAIQEAFRALETWVREQDRRSKRAKGVGLPSLQEPKRKAIRAALLAGVAPGQVARHFGLPLTAVRKVLSEGE
jgi:hypothetical protein